MSGRLLVEPLYPSFMKFTEYYFEMYFLFFRMFLTPPPFPAEQDWNMPLHPNIPRHLYAAYNLLHLPPEASLADARIQYRKLAKRSHPDAGGKHADFLLLQQAYEQVVTYLRANERKCA